MIKFFRHIRLRLLTQASSDKVRQRMLKENRFSRYFLYAIGEIVLVVIGILIALQVNEWNNERNRNKAEAIIIAQLKTDLETSAVELEEVKEFYLVRAQDCAEVIRAFYKLEVPNDSIEDALRHTLSARIYSPILGTARSLINSGNIDRLSSTELKSELIAYVEKEDYILKDIGRYEESYYRTGVQQVKEAMPNTFRSLAYLDSSMKEGETSAAFERSLELKLNWRPKEMERIPFRSDLGELFQDQDLFIGYVNLFTGHRNIYFKYDDILELTNELLEKMDP